MPLYQIIANLGNAEIYTRSDKEGYFWNDIQLNIKEMGPFNTVHEAATHYTKYLKTGELAKTIRQMSLNNNVINVDFVAKTRQTH